MQSKNYFNESIVSAINRYNSNNDYYNKNIIFNKEIYPVLYQLCTKLAHKIIKKKLLLDSDITYEDVTLECVTHLYKMCIPNYQENLGRAFSYFTRSAINFMSEFNSRMSQNLYDDISVVDFKRNIINEIAQDERKTTLYEFTELFIDAYDLELNKLYKGDQLNIANAVLEIFRTREHIQDYEKTALYIFIREITGLPTQKITPVVKKIKMHFFKLYKYYLEFDKIDLNLITHDHVRRLHEN